VSLAKRNTKDAGRCSIYVKDANRHLFSPGIKDQVSFKDGMLVVDIDKRGKNEAGYYLEGHVSYVTMDFRWLTRDGSVQAGHGLHFRPGTSFTLLST
jgi:hypothetical protein